jgi:tetratricopeptide (TPR) repeat protein
VLKIAFVGNCQALALKGAFDYFVQPHLGWETIYVPTYDTGAAISDASTFRDVTTCVRLVLDPAEMLPPPGLDPSVRIIDVPFVTAGWLWPYHGTRHPHADRLKYNIDVMIDCADAFINRYIVSGIDEEQTVTNYMQIDAKSIIGLDRRHELLTAKQRERDRITGFTTTDFIESRIRTELLFSTPFHPKLRLERYLALECFSRLGVPKEVLGTMEEYYTDTFYPRLQVPIHPVVAKHFGLAYGGPDDTYQWLNAGRVTFAEYIRRYRVWDTDVELGAGLDLFHNRQFEEAIVLLRQAVTKTPDSVMANLSLCESLLAVSRPAEAAAAGEAALKLLADDWHLQRVVGVAKAVTGQHQAALPHYRRSIELHKGGVQTYVDLSFSLWQLGKLEEAAAAVKIALAINPTDPHAVARLTAIERQIAETIPVLPEPKAELDLPWKSPLLRLSDGFKSPEQTLVWVEGGRAVLRYEGASQSIEQGLIIEAGPQRPGTRMRISVSVDDFAIGEDLFGHRARLTFRIPPHILSAGCRIGIDYAPESTAVDAQAGQMIAFFCIDLYDIDPAMDLENPRTQASQLLSSTLAPDAAIDAYKQVTGSDARTLMLNFESLGSDCEFGLVQRECGAEPLGLLRFSTVPLLPLVTGIDTDFEGVDDRSALDFEIDPSGEYIALQRRYKLRYHTFQYQADITLDDVYDREIKKLSFLRRKFLEQLSSGDKIFVYKSWESCQLPQIETLYRSIRDHGSNALLWVTQAGEGDMPGCVREVYQGLYLGTMRRFSRPVVGEDHRDIAEWLELCHNAWILHKGGQPSHGEIQSASELAKDPQELVLSAPAPVDDSLAADEDSLHLGGSETTVVEPALEIPDPINVTHEDDPAPALIHASPLATAVRQPQPEDRPAATPQRRGSFTRLWRKIVG